MKKIVIPAILLVSMIVPGCSFRPASTTRSYQDEFRNNRKTLVTVYSDPQEKRSEIGEARIILERELSPGEEDVAFYFVIARSSYSFRIEQQGYMKAGDRVYELFIDDAVSEVKSSYEASSTSYATADSSGVHTGIQTDTGTRIWIDDKFRLYMSKDMIMNIRESQELTFRFYFGPEPATFKIRRARMKEIRKGLST